MRGARWLAHELVAEVTHPPFLKAQAARRVAGDIVDNAAQAYHGISELTRGGRFGAARNAVPVAVGGEVFHGISDKRDALALLRVGFDDLHKDLLAAAPTGHIAPTIAATLDAFDAFYEREDDSMLIRWATEWSTYQAWWQRLRALREASRAAGIPLASSEPPPLPKTVWQRGSEGIGSRLDAAVYLGRSTAFGVMTFMGVWGLFAALRGLRDLKSIGVE